jgi:hypothetical protein
LSPVGPAENRQVICAIRDVAEIDALLGFKPPTIMLTGDIADRHIGNAKMIPDRILSKPVDVNRLLREMETLLGKPDRRRFQIIECWQEYSWQRLAKTALRQRFMWSTTTTACDARCRPC